MSSRSSATSPPRPGCAASAMLAWRDLDDPEAGGSELHASTVAALWGRGRASRSRCARRTRAGHPQVTLARRLPRDPQGRPLHGVPACRVQRDDGLARRAATGSSRSGTACRSSRRCGRAGPRVAWLHHVHDEMWEMTLPPRLAALGRTRRVRASRRRSTGARRSSRCRSRRSTSSSTSCGFRADARHGRAARASTPRSRPAATKSPTPLVVAVGRLVPVKRFDLLIDALVARARRVIPSLRGGDRRRGLRARRARGARSHERRRRASGSRCPGRVDDAELVDLYRRAWVSRARRRTRAGG